MSYKVPANDEWTENLNPAGGKWSTNLTLNLVLTNVPKGNAYVSGDYGWDYNPIPHNIDPGWLDFHMDTPVDGTQKNAAIGLDYSFWGSNVELGWVNNWDTKKAKLILWDAHGNAVYRVIGVTMQGWLHIQWAIGTSAQGWSVWKGPTFDWTQITDIQIYCDRVFFPVGCTPFGCIGIPAGSLAMDDLYFVWDRVPPTLQVSAINTSGIIVYGHQATVIPPTGGNYTENLPWAGINNVSPGEWGITIIGSEFVSWQDNGSTNPTRTIMLNWGDNITLTAIFSGGSVTPPDGGGGGPDYTLPVVIVGSVIAGVIGVWYWTRPKKRNGGNNK